MPEVHDLDTVLHALEDEGAIIQEAIHCADAELALLTLDVEWDEVAVWTMLLGSPQITM